MKKASNDYLIRLARRNVLLARQQTARALVYKAQQLSKVQCKHVRLAHL
jgi:hypothetical protein